MKERLGSLQHQKDSAPLKRDLNYIDRCIDKGNYTQAMSECDRIIRSYPNLGIAYLYRGEIFDEMGKWEEALKDYRTAVRLDPNLEEALDYLDNLEEELEEDIDQQE